MLVLNALFCFTHEIRNGQPSAISPHEARDVIPEEELWKVFTFLETVQKK